MLGQATTPKEKLAEYPLAAESTEASIGAEFMVHSIMSQEQTWVANDFLVVEVALYPKGTKGITIANSMFKVSIDGKRMIDAQSPYMAASEMTNPYMDMGSGGVGGIGQREGPRFPGDTRPDQNRLPVPPGGTPRDNSGVEQRPVQTMREAVIASALPEGKTDKPVSGLLYFPFRGKLKKVKSIELVTTIGSENVVLRLR
jgi:hypothetical protein